MSAFVFHVQMKCSDCCRHGERTLRLRPFTERLIKKEVGCELCKSSMLMYFYSDTEDIDDDSNGDLFCIVQRVE